MLAQNITELIGDTPIVKVQSASEEVDASIYVKLENFNPMSSVKDRLGIALIKDAEDKGLIGKDSLIVESTSGNTGIALAFICAQRGYKLAITMPESMSMERRQVLKALGAQLHLTPAHEGMSGAIKRADDLVSSTKNAFRIKQFENQANPNYHEATTGPEIYKDLDGQISAFVAGIGTGGTFTGVSRFFKKQNAGIKTYAVEPEGSAVLSGNPSGPHKIQGIGAGFIPKTMDVNLIDEIIKVNEIDAANTARRMAKEDGLFLGISSGANVFAAMQVAKQKDLKDSNIVTIACDTGERYISTWIYQEED